MAASPSLTQEPTPGETAHPAVDLVSTTRSAESSRGFAATGGEDVPPSDGFAFDEERAAPALRHVDSTHDIESTLDFEAALELAAARDFAAAADFDRDFDETDGLESAHRPTVPAPQPDAPSSPSNPRATRVAGIETSSEWVDSAVESLDVESTKRGRLLMDTYLLDSLLGEGAMGSVWRATNVKLGKAVAVKMVKLALDPSAHTRLRNEARLAARVTHQNVVDVFDTGVTEDGSYYLVMELLSGTDLGKVLEARGRFSAEEAVQIVLPILAGLEAAHKKRILHRDIKPENIFLVQADDRCIPKLVDFGIALAGDVPQSLRTTRVGALLGTPLYMAPEQARGSLEIDERTDLWSVSTLLYELLTGGAPFARESLQALFFAIACHPVPPLPEGVGDSALEAILLRGLAKNPAERWTSAREMGVALALWLRDRGVTEDVSAQSLDSTWLRAGSNPSLASIVQPVVTPLPPPLPRVDFVESTQQASASPSIPAKRRWTNVAVSRRRVGFAAAATASVWAAIAFFFPSEDPTKANAALLTEAPLVVPPVVVSAPSPDRIEANTLAPSPEPKSTTTTTKPVVKNKRAKGVDPNWGF